MEFMLSEKSEPTHRPIGFWTVNFLICATLGLISAGSRYHLHEGLTRSLVIGFTTATLAFCLTSLLRGAYLKNIAEPRLKASFLGRILSLALAAAFIHGLALQLIVAHLDRTSMLDWRTTQWAFHERLYIFVLLLWVLYLGWTFGYFWVRAEFIVREETRLEAMARAEAQKMELQLLRFQLDPHFLFNTLNGIISEIPSEPAIAMEMVGELSSYLKYSLDHRKELLTRLSAEMDATAAYLRVQKARFGDRIEARIQASQSARMRFVPSFLLQPLVENAFKHGFAMMPPPWILDITAETNGEHLIIRVANTGQFQTSNRIGGVGLDSIRRRLEIHYPGHHHFTIGECDGAVVATIDLEGDPCNE
jgi:signal transduction histidine kinase